MKTFSVPVIYTITGWIMISADNIAEAKQKANVLNDEGVCEFDIKDGSVESEVLTDEIAEEL